MSYIDKVGDLSQMSPEERAQAAVALLQGDLSTETLMAMAQGCRNDKPLETFVPLFLTNTCDADCAMCGMRKQNDKLTRKFSTNLDIDAQMDIIHNTFGVSRIGFLTGEYLEKTSRLQNCFYVGWALDRAIEKGFEQVIFNIGSMTDDEIEVLDGWTHPHKDKVMMCVFQETYDKRKYDKVMGSDVTRSPKADFERRLDTCGKWVDLGYQLANIGFLVGLHNKVETEMYGLIKHCGELLAKGATVYLSLPRLRPASGASNKTKVNDEQYLRIIAVASIMSSDTGGVIITTREEQAFQHRVAPLISVFSPGSPDVSPYHNKKRKQVNDIATSQFQIPEQRQPDEVLRDLSSTFGEIAFYTPPVSEDIANV